jgi:hypothetical protein
MRTKTHSKHFYDDEIKGVMEIDGKKVIYLKSHVKRLYRYDDHLLEDQMDHLNKKLIFMKRLELYLKRIVGLDDFEDNS